MILAFHLVVLYFIGVFLAYGYIDLNNKFENRREKFTSHDDVVGVFHEVKRKTYYIKKKNMFKSWYFFITVFGKN